VFVFSLTTTSSSTTTTKILFQFNDSSFSLFEATTTNKRMTSGSVSLNIRSFYVPYGLEDTPYNKKPTKSGITWRISDLAQFLSLAAIIDASHPQLPIGRVGLHWTVMLACDAFWWNCHYSRSLLVFCMLAIVYLVTACCCLWTTKSILYMVCV